MAQSKAGALIFVALAAGSALVVAQSLAHLIATLGFDSIGSPVDLDRSNGIPDVVSTILILVVSLGAFALAVRSERRRRRHAVGLGIGLVVLAVDDALQQNDLGSPYGLVVIATLVVTALLILVLVVVAPAPRSARICTWLGLALLAVGVRLPYAYDQLMNALDQSTLRRGDVLYELGVVLDEGAELMGWTLLACGVWATALALPSASRNDPATPARSEGPHEVSVHDGDRELQ